MNYQVEISSVAEAEVDNAFLRLSQVMSPEKLDAGIRGY